MKPKQFCWAMILLVVSFAVQQTKAGGFIKTKTHYGIEGTELPEIIELPNFGECYLYTNYIVQTKTDENHAAEESIQVEKRVKGEDKTLACTPHTDRRLISLGFEDSLFFAGISGRYMAVVGEGPGISGIGIYDLDSGKRIFHGSYDEGRAEIKANRILSYLKPLRQINSLEECPKDFKRVLPSVWIDQKVEVDLETGTEKEIGKLECTQHD